MDQGVVRITLPPPQREQRRHQLRVMDQRPLKSSPAKGKGVAVAVDAAGAATWLARAGRGGRGDRTTRRVVAKIVSHHSALDLVADLINRYFTPRLIAVRNRRQPNTSLATGRRAGPPIGRAMT